MINLEWYAAIGYGDILLPISYAHNISQTFQEEVNIRFLYREGVDYRYNENSKEFLWEQADYLNSICDKSDIAGVALSHKFHDTSKIRWSGYDESLIKTSEYHNHWYVNQIKTEKKLKIVVGSTVNNKVPFTDYNGGKKLWKSSQDWDMLENSFNSISDKYQIVHIDYTTPLNEAIEELKDASLFIGYHGGMAWLAKFCATPSILLVHQNNLSYKVFPNAMISRSISMNGIDHIELLISECNSISERYMSNFKNRESSRKWFEQVLSKTLHVP